MKQVSINEQVDAVITQMRIGDVFGDLPEHMEDGNMIPNRCKFAGKLACAEACQLKLSMRETGGKMCAEENMATVLGELDVRTESFINVQCTGDNVTFGDMLTSENTTRDRVGFTVVPASNAFFFRPGIDKTPQSGDMTHAAMRMADCGDVIYTFADWDGNDVVGISHFSRPNMLGPSAYKHEIHGKKVSWAEYVLGSAVDHYGVDPATVDIKLVAAIEGKDFVHSFDSEEKSREMFAGWEELGFIHNTVREDGSVECLIDYREMIEWQLKDSIQDFGLRQYMNNYSVDLSEVINTGDLSLGHASHHAAEHYGTAENGRDWYIVGLKHEPRPAKDDSSYEFDLSHPWSAHNHPWMEASQFMYEQVRAQDPTLLAVDDPDPMIRLATLTHSRSIAPRKFWDTPEMWERAQQEYMHPYTLWCIASASGVELNDPEYIAWLEEGY